MLEPRLLLYSDLGDQWTYDSRITYSFMPDGTSVGGVSSVLFQTLNAKYATATWEGQIEDAASLWETATNVNLALVSDGGEPVGTNGDQQDDPRFGDIRIGMVPLPIGRPRRNVSAPAGQRRHRRRRHHVQFHGQLADQFQLRPDDRRCTRVRPRAGPGRVNRFDGRHVRHV